MECETHGIKVDQAHDFEDRSSIAEICIKLRLNSEILE